MEKAELEYLKALIFAEMQLAKAYDKKDVVTFCEQFHSMINSLIDKISTYTEKRSELPQKETQGQMTEHSLRESQKAGDTNSYYRPPTTVMTQ